VTNVVETIVVVTNAKLGWVDEKEKNSTNDGQTKVVVTNVDWLTYHECMAMAICYLFSCVLYTIDRMYMM
jgi:hypothetical protein